MASRNQTVITERTAVSGVVLYAILGACMAGAFGAIKVAMSLQHMDDRITALEVGQASMIANMVRRP